MVTKVITKAMVVLSGGQDSTTCLLDARSRFDEVHAITFNYGQRHDIEITAAIAVAELCGVKTHAIVNASGLLQSRSPLTSDTPLKQYTDFASMAAETGDRIEDTFVPLRNPFFLLIAANHALSIDCYTLITGVCQGDNANYPDCTAMFVIQMEAMVNEALGLNKPGADKVFNIEAPLMFLSKADTVRMAVEHGRLGMMAMALTHTCYAGQRPPCGTCHACVQRAAGFAEAGMPDPLIAFTKGEKKCSE